MARWRLAAIAAIAWAWTAFLLAFDLASWVQILPAVTCLGIAVIWNNSSLRVLAMLWIALSSFAWIQVDYHELAKTQATEGVQQVTFEVLGSPRPVAGEYLNTIALIPSEAGQVRSVGFLKTNELLLQGATYQGWIELSGSGEGFQREVFWASARNGLEVLELPDRISGFVIQLRESFLANLIGITPDAAGLVAGLAIGDDSQVSTELKRQMTALSLSHLVAVSGANLAIVAGGAFLLSALIGLRRLSRILVAAIVTVFYVLLVGPEPSVVRAALMALAVLVGQSTGRGNQGLNSLGLAVLILVNLDPLLSVEFGFSLSVFATLGLLVLAPALHQRLNSRLPTWLSASLAVAVAAQLFTLPVLLVLENRIATYSVVANLLTEPVVAPVTVLGMIAVLVAIPFPWLGTLVSWVSSVGTAWIELIATSFSSLPLISLPWIPQPYSTIASVLIVTSVTLFVLLRRPVWLLAILTLVIPAIFWVATDVTRYSNWPVSEWQVISCDVGQGDATLIRSQGKIVLIDTGREPELLLSCLQRAEVREVDLLILSHFDADHVAAVPQLVDVVDVGKVLISGFIDDRPLADSVRRSLREAGVAVSIGQSGLSFQFGDGEVTILQPSLTAREAKDANDASLVLRADFPGFSFLALGDLGEEGQTRLLRSQPAAVKELSTKKLVLKVSHHGSADQSIPLISALRPDFALISAGLGNPYGHPRKEALEPLIAMGSKVLRTDILGSIALGIEPLVKLSVAGKL